MQTLTCGKKPVGLHFLFFSSCLYTCWHCLHLCHLPLETRTTSSWVKRREPFSRQPRWHIMLYGFDDSHLEVTRMRELSIERALVTRWNECSCFAGNWSSRVWNKCPLPCTSVVILFCLHTFLLTNFASPYSCLNLLTSRLRRIREEKPCWLYWVSTKKKSNAANFCLFFLLFLSKVVHLN